jgi:hypothetical protein
MAQIIANITSGSIPVPNSHFIQYFKRRDDLGPNEIWFEQSNNRFYSIRGAWGELKNLRHDKLGFGKSDNRKLDSVGNNLP